MPTIITVIGGTIVAVDIAASVALTLIAGLALTTANLIINKALQKKKPTFKDPGTSLDSTVSSAPPRRVVYGECHFGGERTFISSSENPVETDEDTTLVKNEMLHLVHTFAGHEVRQFKAVMMGDYPIYRTHLVLADGTDVGGVQTGTRAPDTPLFTDMYVATSGRYSQYIRAVQAVGAFGNRPPIWSAPVAIDFSYGDEAETVQPFPYLNSRLPELWDNNAKQIGCAKIHLQMMYSRDRFPNGVPNISAIVRGKKIVDVRDGSYDAVTPAYSRNPALIGLDFLLTSVDDGGFGARQAEIDFDSFEAAANVCDEFIDIDAGSHSGYTEEICDQDSEPSVYPRVITADPPDTSRQLGRHKNTILLTRTEVPVRFSSGDRVQVSLVSGGSLPSGLSAATDYYIAVLEPWPAPTDRKRLKHASYLAYGQPVDYPVGDQPDDIDRTKDTWFYPRIALHTSYEDAVDESPASRVALGTIGTGQFKVFKTGEPRYTCDYTYTVDETKRQTLENIASSMAGEFIYTGGKWICKPGAYETPTISLDEDHCVSPLSVQTTASMRDNFNGVVGLYTLHFESRGEQINYPPVVSSTALAEDGGEEVTAQLDLPATTRVNMAQRIAQIKLLDSRQQITFEQDFNFKAYQLRAGDFFYYSNERMGWTNKVFRCLKWERNVNEEDGVAKITFKLSAKETSSDVYEADPALLDADDSAPNTTLPNAFDVLEPTNFEVEEFKRNPSGTIIEAVAALTWDTSADRFVELYEIQWKKADTDTDTYEYEDGVRQRENRLELVNLEAPLTWNFRVRALNHLGVPSEWVEIEQEITGLSDRPADPVGLEVTAVGGQARLQWPQSADLDVFIGGQVLVRHDPVNDPPDWATGLSIQPISVDGGETSCTCPLLAGNYMIKFVDSSGNESSGFAYAYTDQTSVVAYTNEYQIRQETAFSGTKLYCNVNGSSDLTLDTAGGVVEPEGTYDFDLTAYSGNIDDRPGNVDDWADWDATGIVYLAAGGTRRVTAVRQATIDSIATTMDSRTGLVDTWADWDNVSGSEADAWMEARICTEVNPFLLTATWSDWFRVDSAELYYYGLGLREQLRSYEPQGQIEMQSVGADIDIPA